MSAPIVVGAAVATSLFALTPALRFAYEAPELRVALETACALIALLASYLVVGRFLRERHLDSLVLAASLGVLACASLVAAGLLAFPPSENGRLVTAAATAIGALMLAASAFVPQRPLERRPNDVLALVAATGVLVAVVGGDARADRPRVPAGRDRARAQRDARRISRATSRCSSPRRSPWSRSSSRRPASRGGSASRPTRSSPSSPSGAMLGAMAQLDYILFASADGGLVRVGDVFRALFYAVLLVGAAREIGSYWRRLAQTAVLEERRRIARDLHDGVAQELLFIGRRATRLAATGDETAREIQASAERALGDSRRAIAALTRPLDQPLDEVLTEAVAEVASRYDVQLDLAFEPGVTVASRRARGARADRLRGRLERRPPRPRQGRPPLARRRATACTSASPTTAPASIPRRRARRGSGSRSCASARRPPAARSASAPHPATAPNWRWCFR